MHESGKIRVLQTIRQGNVGGGESHLLGLVGNLDRNRFDTLVLSYSEGPMVTQLREMKIPCIVTSRRGPFNLLHAPQLQRFLRDERIDLVHAHGTRAYSNIFWPARRCRLPILYTIHGWSFHNDLPLPVKMARIWGERILTRHSSCNISVSNSNRITGQHQLPGFQSVVIHNGIDMDRFNPGQSFPSLRTEWGISDQDVLVLFIARFSRQKQPLVLIRAFARAQARFPRLRLLMVGEGNEKEEGLKLAQELGLGDKVIFLPFRQDVPAILSAADLFVLPSLWEGFPIALLEAMAMGKAIIATAADGTSEIIIDGYNGILPDPGRLEDSLAEAILSLAADPERCRTLGRHARETIDRQFSARHMTRQVEALYLKLAAGRK